MTPPVEPDETGKSAMTKATDLTVATTFTQHGLDEVVQQLGPAVVVEGSYAVQPDGTAQCTVRVFGDPGFIEFALSNQGYGTVTAKTEVGTA